MNWTERLAKIWNLGNVKLQTAVCGLRFPMKNLMLKVYIPSMSKRQLVRFQTQNVMRISPVEAQTYLYLD